MQWLWPVPGELENAPLVSPNPPAAGQVSLLEQLGGWRDEDLSAGTPIRADHFNQLRQALEWITRGRWSLPIYFTAGLLSLLPDTPWLGGYIANNGTDELRNAGFMLARTEEPRPRGLVGVTVREATRIELTADADCTVEIYSCVRGVDFVNDAPTWNCYAPAASASWSAPGGTGGGDGTLLGQVALLADEPGSITGPAVTAAVQAMLDGDSQNFLIRRVDSGYQTIAIDATAVVEFDISGG
jgi:hypothetical protein